MVVTSTINGIDVSSLQDGYSIEMINLFKRTSAEVSGVTKSIVTKSTFIHHVTILVKTGEASALVNYFLGMTVSQSFPLKLWDTYGAENVQCRILDSSFTITSIENTGDFSTIRMQVSPVLDPVPFDSDIYDSAGLSEVYGIRHHPYILQPLVGARLGIFND